MGRTVMGVFWKLALGQVLEDFQQWHDIGTAAHTDCDRLCVLIGGWCVLDSFGVEGYSMFTMPLNCTTEHWQCRHNLSSCPLAVMSG